MLVSYDNIYFFIKVICTPHVGIIPDFDALNKHARFINLYVFKHMHISEKNNYY